MKKIQYFVVDAFAYGSFTGNPAGVCLLDEPLEPSLMQAIAAENRYSETAFLLKKDDVWDVRWFSPTHEVPICGHATLGSAYVILNYADKGADHVEFYSHLSGRLGADREGDVYYIDFPCEPVIEIDPHPLVEKSLGVKPRGVYQKPTRKGYLLALLDDCQTVANLKPDIDMINSIPDIIGISITAEGEDCDYVTRFFVPQFGIPEDPVNGATEKSLIPFWTDRLGKKEFVIRQLSERGGLLYGKNMGERIALGGQVNLYLRGEITV